MKVKLIETLFIKAIPVLEKIETHGFEAYFVGGSVRDKLLNRPIHDIDIASSARPDEIQAMFKSTIDVGKEHGTIIAIVDKEAYEITTFRTEGTYSDFRRPDEVHFVRNLKEDTLRRDFTINAIAIDRKGQVYDYHGGIQDLNNKMIRAVGVAKERFNEDALRMMRAIRFASQLGFVIEKETFNAINELAPLLAHISIERIRIEFSKFMQGKYFPKYASLLNQTGLMNYMKGLEDASTTIMESVALQIEPLLEVKSEPDERLCWALLVRELGFVNYHSIRRFLKTWTHSNQFIQDVSDIVEIMTIFEEETLDLWQVYYYDTALLYLVEDWYLALNKEKSKQLDKLITALPIKHRNELVINGRDIMKFLSLDKGTPQVGELFNQIEYLVVTNQLDNDYQTIESYVYSTKDK